MRILARLAVFALLPRVVGQMMKPETDLRFQDAPVTRITLHPEAVTVYARDERTIDAVAFEVVRSSCGFGQTIQNNAPNHSRVHGDEASMELPHIHAVAMASGSNDTTRATMAHVLCLQEALRHRRVGNVRLLKSEPGWPPA